MGNIKGITIEIGSDTKKFKRDVYKRQMQQGCNGLTAFGSCYCNVSMICAVCALIKRAAAYCVTFFLRISTPLGSANFPSQTLSLIHIWHLMPPDRTR